MWKTHPHPKGSIDLSSAGSAGVAGTAWGAAEPHALVGWGGQTQPWAPALPSPSWGWEGQFQAVPSGAGGTGAMLPQGLPKSIQETGGSAQEKSLISSKGKWLLEKDKESQLPELWKALTKYLTRRNRKRLPSVRAFLMQVIWWLLPLLLKRHYFLSDPCKEGLEHTYSFSMCF